MPNNVKKMIQNIKEITGNNYSEDEIYSMLKECSMDPNQTTHNLLSMGIFILLYFFFSFFFKVLVCQIFYFYLWVLLYLILLEL